MFLNIHGSYGEVFQYSRYVLVYHVNISNSYKLSLQRLAIRSSSSLSVPLVSRLISLVYFFSMVCSLRFSRRSLTYVVRWTEHSHSHGHDHSAHDDHAHTRERAVDASETSSGSVTPTEDRSGVDQDPYFGHPAATRQAVVLAAHELEMARSPPNVRDGEFSPSLPSTPHKQDPSTSDDENTRVGSQISENTPLLKDHRISTSSVVHNYTSEHVDDISAPSSPVRSKPKKKAAHGHAGSMNMHALVLHVLGDALGNVGVIATGLIIWLTTWSWKYYFDPLISLVITVIIFSSALPLGQFPFTYTSSCLTYMNLCSEERFLHSSSGCTFWHFITRSRKGHPRCQWCAQCS